MKMIRLFPPRLLAAALAGLAAPDIAVVHRVPAPEPVLVRRNKSKRRRSRYRLRGW